MEAHKFDKKQALRIVLILVGALAVIGVLYYVAVQYVFPAVVTTSETTVSSAGTGGFTISTTGSVPTKDSVAPDVRTGAVTTSVDLSKIIKTADISMTVKDFDASVSSIRGILATQKGYVSNLTDSGTLNDRTVTMVIKVPTDKFDTTLTQVKALGVEVTSANENSDDVTQAYQDLQARLKNQKALEAQLLTILAKATKISDILLVQNQLSGVREQIELLQTQIKYYDTQTDYASISITMTKASEALNVAGTAWAPLGIAKEAFAVLVEVAKDLGTLLIWLVVFSPIVIIPWIIVAIIKKAKKNKK